MAVNYSVEFDPEAIADLESLTPSIRDNESEYLNLEERLDRLERRMRQLKGNGNNEN